MRPPWGDRQPLSASAYSAIELAEDDGRIFVLDQRLLPTEEIYLACSDVAGAADAIRDMVVRGAPAIGITAAYGMVLAAGEARGLGAAGYREAMERAGRQLEATRPTAVNLAWAVGRCLELVERHAAEDGERRWRQMAERARSIHRADVAACRTMGAVAAKRMMDHASDGRVAMLTHCNAGALATGGYGTALGVLRATAEAGAALRVFASETRPYLQGARLTAWELQRDGIDVTVVSDNMVAHCMQQGLIDAIIVGADRIARNGDVANKIGTYGIACLAKAHGLPFYVAAPWSTVDLDTADGASITIEQRSAVELTHIKGQQMVPSGVDVYNPAFDVTPAALVTAIFTELGEHAPEHIADAAVSAIDEGETT